MNMTRQVATLFCNGGEYVVIRDASVNVNPYRVYYYWYARSEYGLRKRRKQIVRYGNLASCICYLRDIVIEHDEE